MKAVWEIAGSSQREAVRDNEISIHRHHWPELSAMHSVLTVNKAPLEFLQEALTRQRYVAGMVSSDKRKECRWINDGSNGKFEEGGPAPMQLVKKCTGDTG